MSTPTKTKAARRPAHEVAADLFQRAEAARVRGIKAQPEYQELEAARSALASLTTQRFAPPQVKVIADAQAIIEAAIKEVLAPPKPAGPKQTPIGDMP